MFQKTLKIVRLIKQSIKSDTYDYTTGNIKKAIALLAIPMILELSLESVFALVDMYFVGHLPNATIAIATVGLTEAAVTIIFTIAIGLSIGATAIIARRVGEKNPELAAQSAAQAIFISLVIAIITAILGVIFSQNILKIMGASNEVIAQGAIFTKILLGSSPAIVLLFVINGIYRGAGNAAMAMKSLWVASGLNIILCPLLIYGYGPFPELGLKGAAVATAIGRSCGVIYQCYYLFNPKHSLKIIWKYFKPQLKLIKSLLHISAPATIQFFIQSGSWIVLSYFVSISGGTEASAGYQLAIRNIIFFILPAWGLSNAAATLVGQNLGAKKPDRAKQSVLLTTKYNIIFMSLVSTLFLFFSTSIVSMFTNEANVLSVGSQALQIVGFGSIFYGIAMVMIQALNGAGDTKTPTWINLIVFWIIQIPLGWILTIYLNMGPIGSFIAIPSSEILLAWAGWYYFKKGKWIQTQV